VSSSTSSRGLPATFGPARGLVSVCLGALLAAPPAHAATIHVPGDQPTIQAGIDAASTGDSVLVACGTYYETDLTLESDIHLLAEQASPACVTVDPEENGGYLHATDVSGTTVRGMSFRNGSVVSNYAMTLLRSTVTFENCAVSLTPAPSGYGYSGVCLVEDSSPTFQSCDFLDNETTAVRLANSTAEFRDCAFAGGNAHAWVGQVAGARVEEGSTVLFEDCDFSLNGIRGGYPSGGFAPAIAVIGSSASVTCRRCLLDQNNGYRAAAGAVFVSQGTMLVDDCRFENNQSVDGGAAFVQDNGSLSFTDCTFEGNWGAYAGDVVGVSGAAASLHRCRVEKHVGFEVMTVWPSGSLSLTESVFWINDGTILATGGNVSVSRCTFYRGAAYGGFLSATSQGSPSTFVVERSILAKSWSGAVDVPQTSTITFSCSDLFENSDGDWIGSIADQLGVDGNFSADPLFCDALARDVTLRSDSPCLPGNHPDGTDCGLIGALDQGCSPVNVEPETWAGIKARYRR